MPMLQYICGDLHIKLTGLAIVFTVRLFRPLGFSAP